MRTFHALCCVVLLWTAAASAQTAPVRILIISRTQPASAGGDAQTIAGVFESFVLTQITKTYPCAEPLTTEDVRNLLTYDRTRQLLDPKYEGGLETIAGAMGANYYVSITVTSAGAGRMVVNAATINMANAQVVSRTGSTYASAEAASKAMGPLVNGSEGGSTRGRVNCAKRPGFDEPVWKVLNGERSSKTSASVEGTTDALAEVSITNGQARIALKIPAVEGGTMVERTKVTDANCEGSWETPVPDISAPWASEEVSEEVTVTLDPKNPNQLLGTKQIEPGVTIQWTLSKR
ncbi:MAG: hypothetical protein WCP29_19460 [Acidobacteriota bacterium]